MSRLDWVKDPEVIYIYNGPGFLVVKDNGTLEHVDLKGRQVQFDEAGAPFVVGADEIRYYIPVFHRRITSLDEA